MKPSAGWRETTLGEVVDFSNGRTSPTRIDGGAFPVFGSNGVIGFSDETNTYEETIVIGRVGSYCGSLYFSRKKSWVTDNAIKATVKDGVSNPRFLWYLLHTLHLNARATGSGQPLINQTTLGSIDITIPELTEQKEIATVLSCLDNKIELLRRQNETLEQTVQTLFNEWIGNGKSATEGGWKMVGLPEIANFLNGLALQKYPATNPNDYLPVIKIRELKSGITDGTDKAGKEVPEQYVVGNGDILFSWSGSLEVVIWKYGKGALNQHLFKVSSDKYPKWFVYLWLLKHLPSFRSIAANKATTMGHIQRAHLQQAKVIIPPEKELARMDNVLAPIFSKLIENNANEQTLIYTRDLLLPKLMRGEIRVGMAG